MHFENHHLWNRHPILLGAAASLIIASLAGTIAITASSPSARREAPQATMSSAQSTADQHLPGSTGGDRTCASCGTVQSIRIIEAGSAAKGIGAVLGEVGEAITGKKAATGEGAVMTPLGADDDKATNAQVIYRVTVHMDDGSFRAVSQRKPPSMGPGAKVLIVDGVIVPRPK